LLLHLRTQLVDVEGEVVEAEVTALEQRSGGEFAAQWGGTRLVSRTVLLATGVVDPTPALPGIEQVQQRGLLRQCPICDGYEHRGQRILVIGDGSHAAREAAFIGHFSAQVAHAGLTCVPESAQGAVRLLSSVASGIEVPSEGGVRVHLADGQVHGFDVAYAAVGVRPRSELGRALGATVDSLGSLVKDEEGATNVPGLYAAGDVACGLDQLVVAAAQGAVAATAIHNRL
jgi:thioredoxin reductase (NADPH)